MRRSTPFLLVLGLLFAACANSSTPGDGSGTGGPANDAGSTDEPTSYGDDDASSTVEDSGQVSTSDAGKEGGLPIYDAGSTPDTGSTTAGACDDSGGTYSSEYIIALGFGLTLGLCSDGCKATECCFTLPQGAGDPVCLAQ